MYFLYDMNWRCCTQYCVEFLWQPKQWESKMHDPYSNKGQGTFTDANLLRNHNYIFSKILDICDLWHICLKYVPSNWAANKTLLQYNSKLLWTYRSHSKSMYPLRWRARSEQKCTSIIGNFTQFDSILLWWKLYKQKRQLLFGW